MAGEPQSMPGSVLIVAILVIIYTTLCMACGMLLVYVLVATKERFTC